LAESKNHFKIRNGEIEIEYEGPLTEVNKRFDQTYLWATSAKTAPPNKTKEKEIDESLGEKKKSNRGGHRKEIYPPYIKKLKEQNFFTPKKSIDEVEKKLKDLGAPTVGKRTAICNALMNDTRKENSKLHATKEGKIWSYWED
jgi:hypothetical protein